MNSTTATFPLEDYDLDATLSSGQAFRWKRIGDAWEGVVASRWVRLRTEGKQLFAQTAVPVADWEWLRHYLQLDVRLDAVLARFPDDEPMRAAVKACHGLRVLRQDVWECLACFICSSTKQIVQIEQIISLLCARFGQTVETPADVAPVRAFPTREAIAAAGERALRECKMGFRAPYLFATARLLTEGKTDLNALSSLPLEEARARLLEFPGVGRKIADCVLLFAGGFDQAFPVDVWILRALRQLYFPRRRPKPARLLRFTETYFGPYAGHAQQYLFHYMRVKGGAREKPGEK
jgi:N-glycosylase/DNA lyase